MSLKIKDKTCIKAKNIWFSYGSQDVLEGISISINKGEFVGVAGPNGAGKTTLMKILVGLLKPQKGTVSFTCQRKKREDKNKTKNRNEKIHNRPHIGYVPQNPTLKERQFPVTVREIVSMGRIGITGMLHPLSKTDKDEVNKAITEAGLEQVKNELFGDLSGGQQQRVLVARALVSEPHILTLDEPTSGVDAKAKYEFYKLLAHLHKKHNMTIIIILHDIPDITKKVERLIFLKRKILYDGPAKKIGTDGLWKLMQEASRIE